MAAIETASDSAIITRAIARTALSAPTPARTRSAGSEAAGRQSGAEQSPASPLDGGLEDVHLGQRLRGDPLAEHPVGPGLVGEHQRQPEGGDDAS